jgi:hypothetical protein
MVNLTLTEQDAQLVLAALAKQPYEVVAQIITNIHTQIVTQGEIKSKK